MIKKYVDFIGKVNEEAGIRNLKKLIDGFSKCEIFFHKDLDGVASALVTKEFFKRYYDINLIDCHIIQYGAEQFSVPKAKKENGVLPILVDFASGNAQYKIQFDHHENQRGSGFSTVYAKPARSNSEIISDEISYTSIFSPTDIELIKTVDSADFVKHGLTPEDIQKSIFTKDAKLSAEKNRFMMGFVVNRLILAYKNKKITVKSLDGKHQHTNKFLLECLVMDSSPSLYSMYNNLIHYVKNAKSLEYNRGSKSYDKEVGMVSPEELMSNLNKYISTREEVPMGSDKKWNGIKYDKRYKIISQTDIGYVIPTGSYDRYVPFKNFPDSEFLITIFTMGLIQASGNPFKAKSDKMKSIDMGAIAKEALAQYKTKFEKINVPLTDIKKENESDIEKRRKKFGPDYDPIGFTFEDLINYYDGTLIYLPNRKSGDMKTVSRLDLHDTNNEVVNMLRTCMNKYYSDWTAEEKEEIGWIKVPVWNIITGSSGGHKAITNISGINYCQYRPDLLKILFGKEDYRYVMKLVANTYNEILKSKIDMINNGQEVTYNTSGVEFGGKIVNENFEYFIMDNDIEVPVSRDEFIKYGSTDIDKKLNLNIQDNKVIGKIDRKTDFMYTDYGNS